MVPLTQPADPTDLARYHRAQVIFSRWLLASRGGENAAIDDLCAEHPELEAHLRALHGEVAGVLSSGAASVSKQIAATFGAEVDPSVTLESESEPDTGFADQVFQRLASQPGSSSQYRIKGEVGRGGMATVLRVWDDELRRHLAMKVLRRRFGSEPRESRAEETRTLARFLEEAQVTSQLDHPGIVPVHELGLDGDGQVFFTMKLVKGRTLKDVIRLSHESAPGWTRARVLEVVLKVCDAMAYAHDKGVIHRDLKPANVMVGRFGAVYVMDWGLARILGREETKNVRIRDEAQSFSRTMSMVHSDRADHTDSELDSPLVTMDGDVVGTPAYMSPEQAAGRLDELGPETDVYSVGAILYHVLTGHMPYVRPGTRATSYAIWRWVQSGPPDALHQLVPDVPAELVSICEKAMAREPEQRYASMEALADDLRSFLDGRVVRAYETGAWAEARKWIRRNKPLAAAVFSAVGLLVVGLAATLYMKARSDENARLAAEHAEEAESARANVMRLSAFQELEDLQHEADSLWPVRPRMVARYDDWLARADELVAGLDGHRAQLEILRSRARADGSFAVPEDRWWHEQLVKLVDGIERFSDPDEGCVYGISPEFGWGVARRKAWVEAEAPAFERARALWKDAVERIADRDAFPALGGLALDPIDGLLPLGPDPVTHLWEFAHLASGEPAVRSADGKLVIGEQTGLVLVLLPGGAFDMGAQRVDASAPGFSPLARDDEGPVHEVYVSPFLLSKYEVTQAQWERATGANPSEYRPGKTIGDHVVTPLHPVEDVSWDECVRVLGWMGLTLPSEAQWEYAARAGTATAWSVGEAPFRLRDAANVADAAIANETARRESWDDGYVGPAPVGTFRPNGFGLHDIHGNVMEWCLDTYRKDYYARSPVEDPVSDDETTSDRVFRGGSFMGLADEARSAYRKRLSSENGSHDVGVRPALVLPR